eukprot:202626-Alexandrium_andersonii.AAC.1
MALVKQSTKRLCPDPCVTVGALQMAIESVLAEAGTRDLMSVLSSIGSITWKHAPRVDQIVQHAVLVH